MRRSVPSELTTMAGRRLRQTVLDELLAAGVRRQQRMHARSCVCARTTSTVFCSLDRIVCRLEYARRHLSGLSNQVLRARVVCDRV